MRSHKAHFCIKVANAKRKRHRNLIKRVDQYTTRPLQRVNHVRKDLLIITLFVLLFLGFFSTNTPTMKLSLAQANHDLAVTQVTPSATSVRVGELVNISVVIENKGTETENSTVSLYYDTTIAETKPVTNLQPALSTTLVFTWNTTSLREEIYADQYKEKFYAIKAEVIPVAGETETQDNQLTSSSPIRVFMQYIAVIPQRTVDTAITPGKNYTVSIYTDYNGTDIYGWQFSLSYNPILLEGVEVRNGDLVSTDKHPDAKFMAGTFNNTLGQLSLTAGHFEYTTPPPITTSGPGILAYVTFRVRDEGESNITLTKKVTKLFGPDAEEIISDFEPSFDHILYGSFSNTEIQIVHDIAVVRITPSSTSVTKGERVNITVVVENQGTIAEIFDVAVYYDYNPPAIVDAVGPQQKVYSLAPNANYTLTFTWDTTNREVKSYTLTAVVPDVPGETDKTDNKLQSNETITVKAREVQPLPITEIIVGVAVLIAVVTGIVIFRRKRKKPLPE